MINGINKMLLLSTGKLDPSLIYYFLRDALNRRCSNKGQEVISRGALLAVLHRRNTVSHSGRPF